MPNEVMLDKVMQDKADKPTNQISGISNDELLQIFAAHSSINLAVFDADIKFVYLNESAVQLLGQPRSLTLNDLLGQHWQALGIPAKQMQPIEAAIQRVLQSGQSFSGKHAYTPTLLLSGRSLKADLAVTQNNQRIFEFHLTPIVNEQQVVYRVAMTAEDITKREIANETAKAYEISEKRFRALTAALPVLIAHVDQNKRYTYNSPYYAKLVGKPITEITGHYLWDILGEESYAEVEHHVSGALAGKKQSYPLKVALPDGRDGYFHTIMIPEFDKSSYETCGNQREESNNARNVTGYYAVTYDVTELTLAQNKTLTQERHMAHMNRISTVNEMTSNIAHELNQPLTAINTYSGVANRFFEQLSEALQADTESTLSHDEVLGDIRLALNSIQQQTTRASKIITEVRGFVRQQQEETTSLDLHQLLDDVLHFSQSTLLARQTMIHFNRCDSNIIINGEATPLQQVFINLILNAADAMETIRPPDERFITITTQIVAPSKQDNSITQSTEHCEVIISDNGAPLTQSDIDNIFEPFFTTKPDGMGMGLAICNSIAEAHGGRLSAKPNATQGLSMSFILPLSQ